MDEHAIREQVTIRFRRREIFLAHFLLWAVPGLIIGGVIMPPAEISRMLRVVFQSWALLVAAHAGVLLYLEFRERAIHRAIQQARAFTSQEKRKRTPLHDLELDEDDAWLDADEAPQPRRNQE